MYNRGINMADDSELQELMDDEMPQASVILNQLITAWVNEKNAPELLKYAGEVVDCMMDQITQMDDNLQSLNRDDFRLVPHQMEVNRIRYILASYHRCRLEKIEEYVSYLLKREREASDEDSLMSDGEFHYAENLYKLLDSHFSNEAIRYTPQGLSSDEPLVTEVQPNLNSSVFIEIVKASQSILVDNCSEEVDLTLGSRHLLPYIDVTELIKEGSAILI